MKNITLAMVAVLAAVTMLSAVLSVAPMQQAIAWGGDGDGDSRDGDGDSRDGDGGNSIKIKQSNECEDTQPNSCTNEATVEAEQVIEVD
jgi:hypothetical protein